MSRSLVPERLLTLPSDPSTPPPETGLMYYNTTLHRVRVYTGTEWRNDSEVHVGPTPPTDTSLIWVDTSASADDGGQGQGTFVPTNSIPETVSIEAYPLGLSYMEVGQDSGWSLNQGYGLVVTEWHNTARATQTFYDHRSTRAWRRIFYGPTTGWTAWSEMATMEQAAPPGSIIQFAGSKVPAGWLVCSGSAVSRDTYAALFDAIGTTYGAGNGSTTFNLPDLRGRVPVGLSTETEFNTLGGRGGTKTVTLTEAEMPSHTHTQQMHNHTQNSHGHAQNAHAHAMDTPKWLGADSATGGSMYSPATTNTQPRVQGRSTSSVTPGINGTTATNQATTAINQYTGNGFPHNNLQPYVTLNYIIRT